MESAAKGGEEKLPLELPMYHKWHAILATDLTEKDKLFDRNALGITQVDADKIKGVTGCSRLEEYLLRMAINEESFSELVGKCLGGGAKSKKTFNLVSQLRMMVRDLTLLHRVSFLMR